MTPALRTPIGLAATAVAVLSAGASLVVLAQLIRLARRSFDQLADTILGG